MTSTTLAPRAPGVRTLRPVPGGADVRRPVLLERADELAVLVEAVRAAATGIGSAVLVTGEAGIGKTSLVRAFAARVSGRVRVLTGACDDLVTPRALGPIRDVAARTGGPLAGALAGRALAGGALAGGADDVFVAVVAELSGPAPTVLLVEDLHWADDAEALVAASLLAPGRPLAFVHPLVTHAVGERMSAAERHRGHRAAARLRADEGAAPELVAAHLMQTEALGDGDGDVVAALRTAARSALAKGAPEPAAAYLRRALEEPPDPPIRPEVVHELGAATVRVSFGEGVALLDEALATLADPVARARAALELARALRTTLENARALAVLDRAIADLTDDDVALHGQLEAEAI